MTTNKSYYKNIYNYKHTPNLVLNKILNYKMEKRLKS